MWLSSKGIAVLTGLVLAGLFVLTGPRALAEEKTPEPMLALLARINLERAKESLEPLVEAPVLAQMADEWADKLAREQKYYHRSGLIGYCRTFGYKGMNENLHVSSKNGFSVDETLASWMASPAHRKNLLMPRLRFAGLGFATGADGKTYVVFNGAVPLPGR